MARAKRSAKKKSKAAPSKAQQDQQIDQDDSNTSASKTHENEPVIEGKLDISIQENIGGYIIVEELANGTYSTVYKASEELNPENHLAIKVYHQQYTEKGKSESKLLESLNNTNSHIIQSIDNFEYRDHACVGLELGLNLRTILSQIPKSPTLNDIRLFSVQILSSLAFLRNNDIIHTDIRLDNILLVKSAKEGSISGNTISAIFTTIESDHPCYKLIDFADAITKTPTISDNLQESSIRAPEVIFGLAPTHAIDMWSFGCTVCEMLLGIFKMKQILKLKGFQLFPSGTNSELIKRMVELLGLPPISYFSSEKYSIYFNDRNELIQDSPSTPIENSHEIQSAVNVEKSLELLLKYEETLDIDFIDFIRRILSWDPLKRLTPGEALVHPFLFPKSFDPYMSLLGSRLEEEKQEMLIEWDNAKTTMVQGWDAEKGLLENKVLEANEQMKKKVEETRRFYEMEKEARKNDFEVERKTLLRKFQEEKEELEQKFAAKEQSLKEIHDVTIKKIMAEATEKHKQDNQEKEQLKKKIDVVTAAFTAFQERVANTNLFAKENTEKAGKKKKSGGPPSKEYREVVESRHKVHDLSADEDEEVEEVVEVREVQVPKKKTGTTKVTKSASKSLISSGSSKSPTGGFGIKKSAAGVKKRPPNTTANKNEEEDKISQGRKKVQRKGSLSSFFKVNLQGTKEALRASQSSTSSLSSSQEV